MSPIEIPDPQHAQVHLEPVDIPLPIFSLLVLGKNDPETLRQLRRFLGKKNVYSDPEGEEE